MKHFNPIIDLLKISLNMHMDMQDLGITYIYGFAVPSRSPPFEKHDESWPIPTFDKRRPTAVWFHLGVGDEPKGLER